MTTIRIDNTGNITYNCIVADCEYHNCATWNDLICPHHDPGERVSGKDITVHVSHPGVRHGGDVHGEELIQMFPDEAERAKFRAGLTIRTNEVTLPPCPGCGSIWTIRAYSEDELIPPRIVTQGEFGNETGKIYAVQFHPKANPNTHRIIGDTIRTQIPHPTLAHLNPGQIEQMKAHIKQQAPDAPTDWMLTEAIQEVIHGVVKRPHVEHHNNVIQAVQALPEKQKPTN